jgi:hypothetical protein
MSIYIDVTPDELRRLRPRMAVLLLQLPVQKSGSRRAPALRR